MRPCMCAHSLAMRNCTDLKGSCANGGPTQLLKAEAHDLHLQLALAAAQAPHDDALAGGDLLVPRVHQVGQGLEGVGGAQPGVPAGGGHQNIRGSVGLVARQKLGVSATSLGTLQVPLCR